MLRIVDDVAVGPYERVVHAEDPGCGLRAIVAVHSTALGPAIGGTRIHPYPSSASAALDVLRLAEGMTLKAAATGVAAGGGKAVIIGDPHRVRRPALWAAYARVIDLLGGTYLTAADVGTGVPDMVVIRRHTPYVLGLPAPDAGWDGDPSPFTARGVLAAMRAAWEDETGAGSLAGARVVVLGAGKVGGRLARMLVADGARVWVSDVRPDPVAALATELGVGALDPDRALTHPCEVLAPCALGGVLTPAAADRLRCRWVVGAANNQLATDAVADRLAARGIGYVPDFVANAGGLICVAEGRNGWAADRVGEAVDRIGDAVADLIEAGRTDGVTPLAAAHRRAADRLALATAAR